MEVFALSLKLKEEGAAAVQAAVDKLRKMVVGVGDAATGAGTESAKGFKGMELAAVAAGAAIAGSLALGLKKVVDESSAAQFAQAQLASALKSTGGVSGQTAQSLNDHASALQNLTSYGDDAINGAQALLLTFTKIQGETFPQATQAVLNVATAMGTDLKSAAIQVGKALNDPIAGVSALARSGIQFTDSQKAMIASLVESGNQAAAQTLILKELESQFGGSAAAARDTLGGALKALGNAFGDLFEITKDGAKPAINAIEGLIKVVQGIGTALNYVNPLLVTFGSLWAAMNFRLLVSMTGMLINTLRGLAGALAIATIEQIKLNVAMASNVFAAIITAAGLATTAVLLWADATDEATDAADKASAADLDYQAALEIRTRRTNEAASADTNAGLSVAQLRDKIALLTRTEQILNAERVRAARDLVAINVIEKALQQNREALAAATAALTAATTTANGATRDRIADLVKLGNVTDLSTSQMGELVQAEQRYATQLAGSNLSLAARLDLLEKQRAVQDFLLSQSNIQMMADVKARVAATPATRNTMALPTLDATQGLDVGMIKNLASDPKVMAQAQIAADATAKQMREVFAESIGNSISEGIAGGFERGFSTGSIGEGFKALTATLLSGLGSAMIRFGTASQGFALLQVKIMKGLSSLNPALTIASAMTMIAIGGALKGVAQGMFGGGGGGGRTSATTPGSFGSSGMGMQGDGNVTRLIFGATSATTAAGMTPRNATNVTIIGPDDPKAQRAIQELISKGNTRGTLG